MDIEKVTVVGAGVMGHGIAEAIAVGGFSVVLEDVLPEALEKARRMIEVSLVRLVKSGKISAEESKNALQRIEMSNSIPHAVRDSDLVVEAVPEIPELKYSIIREITDNCRPDAIVASNTSNIKISSLATHAKNPERVIGMHFFNPPVVMKLVEIIKSPRTMENAFEAGYRFCKEIGNVPVKVFKDSPGFIVNRINAPESLLFCFTLQNQLAKPAEFDAYMKKNGFPMGPCHLLDYVGIDTVVNSIHYYAQELHRDYARCTYFDSFMDSHDLGLKTGKGFYVWKDGKAQIPQAEPKSGVEYMDVIAVEINEAVKLIEEGVAVPADIDTAVKLGMGRISPLSIAREHDPKEILDRLLKLSEKFGTEVFYPAKSIVNGKLSELIAIKE